MLTLLYNLSFCLLKIGGALVQKLKDEQGEFVQFEFVKSIGQNICPLNLYLNKEPSGENIHAMCKQGPIYVRASKALKVWALNELFESDETSENSNGTEDEAASMSTSSSSHSHSRGTKRHRQSTLNLTSQASKCVLKNTETRNNQSYQNAVSGEETTPVRVQKQNMHIYMIICNFSRQHELNHRVFTYRGLTWDISVMFLGSALKTY